jgi:predicted porin
LEKIEMKKTLVAIAALAAVGAASAQSTVTLYGRLDANFGKSEVKATGTQAGTANDPGLAVDSGNLSGSRWGMTGTEDLGGGMKAKFQLESGYGVDTGASAQGGLLFGRTAMVGLSGGFGSISLGRQYSLIALGGWAITGGYANYDAWSAAGATPGAFGNAGSISQDPVRRSNSMLYQTPSMGGLVASFMYAPGENGTPTTSAGRFTGVGVDYGNGPIRLTGQYENTKAAAGGASTKHWIVGGSYNLGVAAISASYQRAEVGTTEDRGYAIGLSAPLGPVTLALEYAREDTDVGPLFASKARSLNLRAIYALSKRSDIYAFLTDAKSNTAGNAGTQDLSRAYVGIRHSF